MKLTCIITGADSGLGKALAIALAIKEYHLVLISNKKAGLVETRDEIISRVPSAEIEVYRVDLSLQQEIKLFCENFKSQHSRLDILINNAGVNMPYRVLTPEGIEYMFAVNYLAPFLLSTLLMENLENSKSARILNIGSNGEKFATLDFDNFNSMKQYCLTKLCLLMFTYKLAEVAHKVSVCCVHPGGIRTNIMKRYHWYSLPGITWFLLYPFLKSPEKALYNGFDCI